MRRSAFLPRPSGLVTAAVTGVLALVLGAALAWGTWMDGRSFLPLLLDPESATVPGDAVLIHAGPRTRAEDRHGWLYRGVRTDRYSYTVWNANGFVELYDRGRDPEQLTNVAGSAAYAPIQVELHSRMQALQRCSRKGCYGKFGPLPRPASRPGLRRRDRSSSRVPGLACSSRATWDSALMCVAVRAASVGRTRTERD